MSGSLPERADLGQLRRQAKELRDAARRADAAAAARLARHHVPAPGRAVQLSAAQLVIARELGFESWPRLVAAVEADVTSRGLVLELVAASVEGRVRSAREIVQAVPGISGRSLLAASVLGDARAVREHLAADPAAAVSFDNGRGWPPLLYACYSRWHQIDPGRAPGLAEVVRLLLEGGASADTNDGGRLRFRSALKGAVEVNNPLVAEVLLEAGANPDLGQPIAEAAGHRDLRCLRLLLSRGARVAGTWALGAAAFHDDPGAITILLEALAAGGGQVAEAATEVLPDAVAAASAAVVAALLDAGADPQASDGDGVSALRLAVRAGKEDTGARLRAVGAADDSTDVDQFLGACLNADRLTVERLLAEHPDLQDRLTGQDREVICEAATTRSTGALALMLDLGFSPQAGRSGEQPLHAAAYHGNTPAVRLLLAAGAEVDARDERFDATPLAFAAVGSGERSGQPGDWTGTVRVLIEAGASRQDVWLTGKPPGEDVADILRQYGIRPAAQAGEPADQDSDQIGADEVGVMAEIARHLENACRDTDLDLLGSLLHPDVHWTGLCNGKAQVLDWYRARLAEGMTVTVRSVETCPGGVVIGLTVTGRAEGARPAPPQRIYQVFIVDGAQITEIHGYGDRDSAVARAEAPVTAP